MPTPPLIPLAHWLDLLPASLVRDWVWVVVRLVTLALLTGCVLPTSIVTAWVWVILRLRAGGSLLPRRDPRVVPWGEGSVLLALLLFFLIQLSVVLLYGEIRVVDDKAAVAGGLKPATFTDTELMGLVSASNLAVIVFVPWLLRVTSGARWRDFGIVGDRFGRNVATGVVAFFIVAPVVYGIFLLAQKVFPPQRHALETMLRSGLTPARVVLAVVSAVVLAPLAEEVLFRAIFQGWLTKFLVIPRRGRVEREPADGVGGIDSGDEAVSREPAPVAAWRRAAPVVLTSLLFGAVHAQQMPAPIPIFVLSLALGVLYQRTGSLIPSITLHAVFNGWSTLALLLASGIKL